MIINAKKFKLLITKVCIRRKPSEIIIFQGAAYKSGTKWAR